MPEVNKYQKSLKLVKQLNYASESDKKNEYSTDDVDESHQMLQELVDKATPKKVKRIDEVFNGRVDFHQEFCGGCGAELFECEKLKYCADCGQALDWSEDE